MREASGAGVTFLFTDIEASTRRWEHDPEAMGRDLARHDDLLRRAVEADGGMVFGHTGDGMCAAFPDETAAVRAAVAAQRELAAAPWEGPTPLRVRMAIHSGPAQRRAGNYFGPTLNRTARLMSVGAGGQVLCSRAAAEGLADTHPDGVDLVDLGEHRLADLSRAERVYQVTDPGAPADFPPLRSLGAHRHNLPVATDSFVGREAELKELDALLDGTRLLSLVGAGGAGKTRLALQVVAAAVDRYADGAWIIELAAIRDPALVPLAVAAALGVDTAGHASPEALAQHLGTFLARRRTLLLVDNCEHLVEAAARLIHDLMAHCPQVSVIATSREVLGVPGEVAWRVPPLSLPTDSADALDVVATDAGALFVERTQAARPGFEVSAANAADVARICHRLDGIPLALELAAARIPLLGVRAVAERLDDCFALLTGGARTAVPRHRTLRATLDWSHGLLEPAEQVALRRLAAFPTSFAFDAAEAVLLAGPGEQEPDAGADAVELLARLVDKSLVVVSDADADAIRYRLLEPVRQYAHERLAQSTEEHDTMRRHRDHFRRAADGYLGAPVSATADWLGRVAADYENIRAALEWSWGTGDTGTSLWLAGRLFPYWILDGRILEGRRWLERTVTADHEPSGQVHTWSVLALGVLAYYSGDAAVALAHLESARDDPASEEVGRSYARGYLGSLATRGPDPAGGERALEASRAEFAVRGDRVGVAWCDFNHAWAHLARGDLRTAASAFERADRVGLETGSDVLVVHARAALATVRAMDGDGAVAAGLADEAVAAARRTGLHHVLVMALARAAETAAVAGDTGRAAGFTRETLQLISELGVRTWVTESLQVAGLAVAEAGDPAAAARLLGAAGEDWPPGGAEGPLSDVVRRCIERLADSLGTQRLDAELQAGTAMPVGEAIAAALAGLAAARPGGEGCARR